MKKVNIPVWAWAVIFFAIPLTIFLVLYLTGHLGNQAFLWQ